MRYLRQSTATTFVLGPALDKGDNKTPVTDLTAGTVDAIDFWKHAATTPTDLSGTTTLTHRSDGMYTATLSASDSGTLGRGRVLVRDDDKCFPFWEDFLVVTQEYYDKVCGSGDLTVDATKFGGSSARVGYIDNLSAGPVALASAVATLLYSGPRGPGVYLDDGAANTNVVVGVDGIESNAVSTIAAATTIAGSLGIQRIYLVNHSVITLAQTYEAWEFIGIGLGNQITLGSQDVDNASCFSVILAGTQGGTGPLYCEGCALGGLSGFQPIAYRCSLTGNTTLRAAVQIIFDHCHSAVPGNATPVIAFSAGTTGLNVRHNSGGWQVDNMTPDHTMSYDGDGQLVLDASCTGGAISRRGCQNITDNAEGRVTVTEISAINATTIEAACDAAVAAIQTVTDNLPNAGALNDLATLASRVTAARAGYFDYLNIGGAVASSAEVTSIYNNTDVVSPVPPVMERPDAGSTGYVLDLYLYDGQGGMEAPDSTPTITATNETGVDRSANLGSVTPVSTGVYKVTYTVANDHLIEQIRFEWTIVEGGVTRKHGRSTIIVDTTAVDFTSADRTKLDTIHGKVPSGNMADPADVASALTTYDGVVPGDLPTNFADLVIAAGTGGVALTAAGLDAITIESGINARQCLQAVLAAVAGVLSGAATTTITIKNPAGGPTRITATVDADGNRSAITLNLDA